MHLHVFSFSHGWLDSFHAYTPIDIQPRWSPWPKIHSLSFTHFCPCHYNKLLYFFKINFTKNHPSHFINKIKLSTEVQNTPSDKFTQTFGSLFHCSFSKRWVAYKHTILQWITTNICTPSNDTMRFLLLHRNIFMLVMQAEVTLFILMDQTLCKIISFELCPFRCLKNHPNTVY